MENKVVSFDYQFSILTNEKTLSSLEILKETILSSRLESENGDHYLLDEYELELIFSHIKVIERYVKCN